MMTSMCKKLAYDLQVKVVDQVFQSNMGGYLLRLTRLMVICNYQKHAGGYV